jgi:DNA-binding beta-propeller fold protein YncE
MTMTSRFSKGTSGIAIDASGSTLAIANAASCRVELYSLPDFRLKCTLGYNADEGPGPFDAANPQKMCFAPNGNLLVAEYNFHRIQEVVPKGNDDHVRYIGEGVFTRGVHGVACDGSVIVATQPDSLFDQVIVFDYKTGGELRRFGVYGGQMGQLRGSQSISITPDGRHVVVAETDNNRVSVFTIEGEFVKCMGNKDVLSAPVDVCVTDSGEIAVVSKGRKAVVVLGGMDCGELEVRRVFGEEGPASGQFVWPSAIAMFRGKLFVGDSRSDRVQVFV